MTGTERRTGCKEVSCARRRKIKLHKWRIGYKIGEHEPRGPESGFPALIIVHLVEILQYLLYPV